MDRQTLIIKIASALTRGYSVHLDSLPGFGLSHFLKELAIEDHYLLYLDGHDFPRIFPKVKRFPTTIILDHFDSLVKTKPKEFFNSLRSLRDQNKYKLTFIIATSHCHNLSDYIEKLDGLFEIASETHLYFPAATQEEAFAIIDTISTRIEFAMDKKEKTRIYALSGGIPSLIKTFVLALNSNDEYSEDRVPGIVNNIYSSLPGISRKALVNGKTDRFLENLGLLRGGKTASVLTTYLPGEALTGREEGLLNHFIENRSQIIRREELMAKIWAGCDISGVTDQALDQTISRLRKKITPGGNRIETIRGLGYRFTSKKDYV